MTGFHKTQLPHAQNQTHDFIWNELLVQYPFIIHYTLPSGMVSLVSTAAFLRPCDSHEWAFSCQDFVGMSYRVVFSLSLPILISLKFNVIVVGIVATEGPDLASGLQSSLISILYSYVKPTHHTYYHHLGYYYPFEKSCPKRHILCVRNLHTHTMIANE